MHSRLPKIGVCGVLPEFGSRSSPGCWRLMKVQFDATLDDFVDVYFRASARSKVVRRWRSINSLATGLIAGTLLYTVIPNWPDNLIMGFVGVVGGTAGYRLMQKKLIEQRLQKYLREKLKDEGPYSIEVETSRDGVIVRQCGNEIRYSWPNIESIVETSDSIDFIECHGGILVVRNRAFKSTDAQLSFLRDARDYHGNCGKEIASDRAQGGAF